MGSEMCIRDSSGKASLYTEIGMVSFCCSSIHRFSSWRYTRGDIPSAIFRKDCAARLLISGMRCSFALHLEILFEELGDSGVAGNAVGVLEDIVAFILEHQIAGLLSGCLELLNDIP